MYAVKGLQNGIIDTKKLETNLALGKNENVLTTDIGGGIPAVVGRVAYTAPVPFEVGVSTYMGTYNQNNLNGVVAEELRWLKIFAVDLEFEAGPITFRTEAAYVIVDIEKKLKDLVAETQWGVYADLIWKMWKGKIGFMDEASFNLAIRFDYVDLYGGINRNTGETIGNETYRVSGALSFRPAPQTSIRIGVSYSWLYDKLFVPSKEVGIQMGLASYF